MSLTIQSISMFRAKRREDRIDTFCHNNEPSKTLKQRNVESLLSGKASPRSESLSMSTEGCDMCNGADNREHGSLISDQCLSTIFQASHKNPGMLPPQERLNSGSLPTWSRPAPGIPKKKKLRKSRSPRECRA